MNVGWMAISVVPKKARRNLPISSYRRKQNMSNVAAPKKIEQPRIASGVLPRTRMNGAAR